MKVSTTSLAPVALFAMVGCLDWFQLGIDVPDGIEVDRQVLRGAERLGRRLDTPQNDSDLCVLVAEVQAFAFGLRSGVSIDSATEEAVSALGTAFRGVSLEMSAQGELTSTVAYGEIAGAATSAQVATLLHATGELLGTGHPAWVIDRGRQNSCTRFEEIIGPMRGLADSWRTAPGCLKGALSAELRLGLKELSQVRCFCDDRHAVDVQYDALDGALRRLRDLDGKKVAYELERTLADNTTVFDGKCGR